MTFPQAQDCSSAGCHGGLFVAGFDEQVFPEVIASQQSHFAYAHSAAPNNEEKFSYIAFQIQVLPRVKLIGLDLFCQVINLSLIQIGKQIQRAQKCGNTCSTLCHIFILT